MASRFYLRDLAPTSPVLFGPWSNTLPGGNYWDLGWGNAALRPEIGPLQVDRGGNTHGGIVHWDEYFRTFVSEALGAQTINAQTWTLALSTYEGATAANIYTAAVLMVWRPSTGLPVGYILDADVPMGAEWGTVPTGQVMTFNGPSVVVADGDVLALELWRHMNTSDDAAQYPGSWQYNGTVPVTAGATSDAASYLECPQAIAFSGAITGTISMASPAPTIAMAGSTLAGRVGTIAINAPALTIAATGTVGTIVVPPVPVTLSLPVNLGYAWTTQQLIDAINANTQHTDCPLDHSDAPDSYHKEPLPRQESEDNALTASGYSKNVLHLKDPAGIYYTTVVAEKP